MSRRRVITVAAACILSACSSSGYGNAMTGSNEVDMMPGKSQPGIEILRGVRYARALGHWSENRARDNDVMAQIRMFRHTRTERELDLALDLYRPEGREALPLVMLIHGGAFYANSRESAPVSDLCRDIAAKGYVCASIDYRMGYRLNRSSVQKARKNAVEDASRAMEFLLSHSGEYAIDPSSVFIGGASSGAITALMLDGGVPGLRGIISMWGGVDSLDSLDAGQAPILAIHGNMDRTVPYDEGYPLGGRLMGYLYGSKAIVERCGAIGRDAELLTLEGYKHAPYRNRDFSFNRNYAVIRDRILEFLEKNHYL